MKSLALSGAMVMAEGVVMSSDLHRDETHGAVELSPEVKFVAEAVNWLLSGMNPREWKVVHLVHHAFQDREPSPEEWAELQQKYPGAPIEAFRDPHSPILEGHLNVLFKNGLVYYRKAAKKILPYLLELEANEVDRSQWPPHLKDVDLTQSRFEQTLDKIPHARSLGLVVTGLGLSAIFGPKQGALTMGVYVPAVLELGGGVNMLGHTGQVKSEWERLLVILGKRQAVPDEKGSYASNFFKHISFVTAGEANHADHHANPGNPFITSTKFSRDPSSAILIGLSKRSFRGHKLVNFPTSRRRPDA